MTLKSSTFPAKDQKSAIETKKPALLERHRSAIQEVLREAKSFSEDRRRTLSEIKDEHLRDSAKK